MNQIIEGLYVGDMVDGATAPVNFRVLNVMWEDERFDFPQNGTHIQTTFCDNAEYKVETDTVKMDEAAHWIHAELGKGKPVLVHCAYGMERSPLTIVWYLMRYKDMTLDQAYEVVKSGRGETLDRKHWLPESVTNAGKIPF